MSFYLLSASNKENNYTTGIPEITAHFECDTVSDLPALSQTDYTARIGSTAHVIENNSIWAVKSGGEWVLQSADGYYNTTQIDAMFAGIPAMIFGYDANKIIGDGDDLNEILEAGVYTAPSTSAAAAVLNSPWTTTRYKFVNFVITGSTAANLRAVQFVFPNLYANQTPVIYIRYRHNTTVTPWHVITATTI